LKIICGSRTPKENGDFSYSPSQVNVCAVNKHILIAPLLGGEVSNLLLVAVVGEIRAYRSLTTKVM
jgi:hypothetical protein